MVCGVGRRSCCQPADHSAPLLNLLAIPLVGLVLAAGFGLMFLALVWHSLAMHLTPLLSLLVGLLLKIGEWGASIPFGSYRVPTPPTPVVIAYFALLLLLVLPGLNRWVKRALGGAFVFVFVLLISSPFSEAKTHDLVITLIDVAQGEAVLIEFPNGKTLLYDAGSIQDGKRAQRAVQSTLWERGISRLDGVVVSHADIDHFNGLPGLFRTVGVESLLVAKPFLDFEQESVVELCRAASAGNIPIHLVARGDRLLVDDSTSLRVLHPAKGAVLSGDNSASVV